jgi:hypothetical protein
MGKRLPVFPSQCDLVQGFGDSRVFISVHTLEIANVAVSLFSGKLM